MQWSIGAAVAAGKIYTQNTSKLGEMNLRVYLYWKQKVIIKKLLLTK